MRLFTATFAADLSSDNKTDNETTMNNLNSYISNIVIFMGVTSKYASILSNAEKQTLVMR